MRGSLGIFNLVDLLQLLAANHSKGLLTVHHPSRGECKLYLDGSGRMLHAAFDDHEGIPAIKAILEDEHGNFEFLPNLSPSVNSIDANISIQALIVEPQAELDQEVCHPRSHLP